MVKNSVALKLYFGHASEPNVLIELLQRYSNEIEENLGQLGVVQAFMEDDPDSTYPALVVDWTYSYLEAERTSVKKLIQYLLGGQGS